MISFSGLQTGLDSEAIVNALVQIERQPIVRLQNKRKDLDSVSARLSDLKTKLEKFKDAADALSKREGVIGSTATSTDDSAVTATASEGASIGRYALRVTSLAKAERTYSDAYASSSDAGVFGAIDGTLTIRVGSDDPVSITVAGSGLTGGGDSLNSLAEKINSSGADVTAGVIFDGTNYRLQVSGNETGPEHAIAFTESGFTAGFSNPANEVVQASSAAFTIDGFEITSSTNQVTEAIPGVTLDLLAVSDTEVQIEVKRDSTTVEEKLQAFVDAYNEINGAINRESVYSGDARVGDSLSGDTTLRTIQGRLREGLLSEVSTGNTALSLLSQIGVTSGNDGSLTLDKTKLEEAFSNDSQALVTLFAGDSEGTVEGLMGQLSDVVKGYVQSGDGILTGRIAGIANEQEGIDDQISQIELRVARSEEMLKAKFANLEVMVSQLNNQGAQLQSMLMSF